jgi:hypothetical protein
MEEATTQKLGSTKSECVVLIKINNRDACLGIDGLLIEVGPFVRRKVALKINLDEGPLHLCSRRTDNRYGLFINLNGEQGNLEAFGMFN